jgi:hypothetical protein
VTALPPWGHSRPGLTGLLTAITLLNLLPTLGLLLYSLSRSGGPLSPLGPEGWQQLGHTVLLLVLVGAGVALM